MSKFNKRKISGVPLEIYHVPLGVRVPQVGNRWSTLCAIIPYTLPSFACRCQENLTGLVLIVKGNQIFD